MSGEFEGKSLDALYAMIASAKPDDITGAGDALAAAVPKIMSIAKDLRHYISRVQWEGEGAEAFRKWGAGMVSETLVLGDFTKVVSEQMKHAGGALKTAQTSVPKPAGMCFADPEKEKARLAAETGPKLQEAISAMERLSSFYDTSKTRITSEKQPEFKPMTVGDVGGGEREYGTGSSTGSVTHSSTGTGSTQGHTTLQRAKETDPGGDTGRPQVRDHVTPPATPPNPPTRPDTEVDTNLDSVKTPPETTTRPPVQPPVTTTTPPPATHQPMPLPLPPTVPPLGQQGGYQQPRPPITGLPSPANRTGLPGPSTLGPMARQEGITGGRQVPGRSVMGQQMGRTPMGTVIGEEKGSSSYGRGAGGMHGQGAGMHGAPNGGQGYGGRRLASQPGGTVGAPSASGVNGRSAFTQGGSGLVRPPASTQPGEEERQQPRHRPDYLSEDEETWTSGQRQIVPPVID
ncbi:hypothetical protein ACIRTB_03030 [Streptomyces sp. NPDC101158]|uniref:hypothetical protein n=1 Tax=Streptomyces sp. NPDC101158 TaxID=3366117 RepID=UPI00380AF15B